MDRTVTWNGATLTAHEPTVASAMDAEYVAQLLAQGKPFSRRLYNRYQQYGEFLSTVEVTDGDPGFALPSLDDDDDALRAGFEAFSAQPKTFQDRWNLARWLGMEKKEPAAESGLTTPPSLTAGSSDAPEPKSD